MSQPYIGEIRMFAGNFAPVGWAMCQGQLMAIAQNDALFNLIGTTYGGDGQATFALPNLAGRVVVHQGQGTGQNYVIGQAAGVESVTLTQQQIPAHAHGMLGSNKTGVQFSAAGAVPASLTTSSGALAYGTDPPPGQLDPSSLSVAGGSQPHENMQPYLTVSFIIALYGVYPQQN
jgi:microcystin-dependent protein